MKTFFTRAVELEAERDALRVALRALFEDWQTLVEQDANDGDKDVQKLWAATETALKGRVAEGLSFAKARKALREDK